MIKKSYVKSRQVYKITFELPQAELPKEIEIETIHLAGEFNDWSATDTPMAQRKDGTYRAQLELEPGREIQFRYLLNGQHWCNDWHADFYVANEHGTENCVVTTPTQA